MALDVAERHGFVQMLAQRIEAENHAVETLRDRMGGGR
jgi:hypothetical protein